MAYNCIIFLLNIIYDTFIHYISIYSFTGIYSQFNPSFCYEFIVIIIIASKPFLDRS